jgi:outer membrane protein assembly factor BamB
VVSGDAVFIIDLDSRMVALDRSDGTILWAAQLPRPEKKRDNAWSGPLLAGNSLWAISNDGRLAAVDPVNGQLRSDENIGISGFSSPILAGGRMIIVSGAGEVSAFP